MPNSPSRKGTTPPSARPKSGTRIFFMTPGQFFGLLAVLAAVFMAGLMVGQGRKSGLMDQHDTEIRRLKDENAAAQRLDASRIAQLNETLISCRDDKETYRLEAIEQCAPGAVERLSAAATADEFSSSYEIDFSLGQEIRLPSTPYRITLQNVIRSGDLLSARIVIEGTGESNQLIELGQGTSASIGRLTVRAITVELVKVKLAVGVSSNQ